MKDQTLLTDLREGVLTVTINRPDKLNALNRAVLRELNDLFDEIAVNEEVSGVIITGAGEKAFVAGADIAEFTGINAEEGKQLSKNGHGILNKIENSSKPVIAAVNGFALGGGCELAMACHMRLASENARFGQPEVNLGLIPGYGGTQRLPRYIGKGKAIELLLTGEMISAEDALQLGLVNYVTSPEELMPRSRSILQKIFTKSPLVVDQVIACVNACFEKGVDGFELETDEFGNCMKTEDFKEGTSAFLEKRKPSFKGR